MSGQGQGAPGGAPPPPVQNTSHLHHRSWGSDDWQRLLTTHFGGKIFRRPLPGGPAQGFVFLIILHAIEK